MRFFILGKQPSTTSVIALSGKAFETLEQAKHYQKTISKSWVPFIVVEVTEEEEFAELCEKEKT